MKCVLCEKIFCGIRAVLIARHIQTNVHQKKTKSEKMSELMSESDVIFENLYFEENLPQNPTFESIELSASDY